ncbi:hypothetical protein UA75_05365 [Actinoalloteichus sp. GBA129-24]|uniref:Uncharacterized protein n=1 Tax=Actinoalloteichus fjordicus TaxID=1612552 RepID=A0AAC9LA41_9PSEU|nr:hypothetical protein UA74_05365 [Actinoalloteichus fjordicus]APU19099.1 hypothetical protein UA75_05365 [Actinoalloteichus sp. GBA129-24]
MPLRHTQLIASYVTVQGRSGIGPACPPRTRAEAVSARGMRIACLARGEPARRLVRRPVLKSENVQPGEALVRRWRPVTNLLRRPAGCRR